jgi:hypothetical protein
LRQVSYILKKDAKAWNMLIFKEKKSESTYWNMVHGRLPGEASADAEGLRTMRNLARNMTFLMKSIALGREKYGLPETESGELTNFVREDIID